MKSSVFFVASTAAAFAAVTALFGATYAWSQSPRSATPTYLPVGSHNVGGSTKSLAWLLDTSNGRLVVCQSLVNQGGSRAPTKPQCEWSDLPR